MEKRTLTIEEMIANGASWAEITAAVREIQKQVDERRKAEEKAKKEKARRAEAEAASAARERMVQAFVDWGIAEGFVPKEDKEEFAAEIEEAVENITIDMRHALVLRKILG